MVNILDFLKLNNLQFEDKTFVVAVSTGIDSSVLLDQFIKLKENFSLTIIVAHVNHHKRAQSEEEEEYIKGYCQEKGIKIYVKELFFDDSGDNFQAKARKERYEFFENIIVKEDADYLVLAHHANDNVETILMRLLRGSSLAGYSGIQAINTIDRGNYCYQIIRPLLFNTRNDISEYQKIHNIKYFEDYSNDSDDYTRNRIRHQIVPLLEEESNTIYNKINDFSRTLREASIIVNEKRDLFIENNVLKEKDKIVFSKSRFLAESKFMQEEILFELLKPQDLSKANIIELIKIIASCKANYRNFFKKLFDFIIEYDNIIISYQHQENYLLDFCLTINEIGNYSINDKMKLNVMKISNNYITNLQEMCYNIYDLPITIRTRKNGDKIKLSAGYKKVNDLFIDLKISQKERDEILLAIDKNNEVLMVFGYKKSEVLKQIKIIDGVLIKLEETKNG